MSGTTQIILAAISGGVMQALFSFFINRKKEKRLDFEFMMSKWTQENERLRKKEEEQTVILQNQVTRINELTILVAELKSKLVLLEAQLTKSV